MGHYTRYKEYMKKEFWPWFWSEPCDNCDCIEKGFGLFDNCDDYDKWLERKPIYNKPLDPDGKKPPQVS